MGLYVHIPFCLSKCRYCGFYSSEEKNNKEYIKYTEDLIEDFIEYGDIYGKKYVVDTIFIGGGTPSILSGESMEEILDVIRERFEVEPWAEITMEANPKTLTLEKLKQYRNAGINRLSIGLQSFDATMLANLGRAHTVEDFEENFAAARECGFQNINIDLMFAIPGQTLEIWEDTLDKAIQLSPEHISFYSLQIEEDTPFFQDLLEGRLVETDQELDRKMYHMAIEKLRNAGYEHYEISSCAKHGYKCKHNLKYWSMDNFLGVGKGASSYLEGTRFAEAPYYELHVNSFADNVSEFVFTGLRKTEGIRFAEFEARYKMGFWEVFGNRKNQLEEFFRLGQLIEENGVLRLSEEGFDISNRIMAVFV